MYNVLSHDFSRNRNHRRVERSEQSEPEYRNKVDLLPRVLECTVKMLVILRIFPFVPSEVLSRVRRRLLSDGHVVTWQAILIR